MPLLFASTAILITIISGLLVVILPAPSLIGLSPVTTRFEEGAISDVLLSGLPKLSFIIGRRCLNGALLVSLFGSWSSVGGLLIAELSRYNSTFPYPSHRLYRRRNRAFILFYVAHYISFLVYLVCSVHFVFGISTISPTLNGVWTAPSKFSSSACNFFLFVIGFICEVI